MDNQNETEIIYIKLFNVTILDPKKDEIEEKYEKALIFLQNITKDLTDKEIIDCLTTTINKDKTHEEIVCLGMITRILTEPSNAEKVYQDLRMLNRDGFQCVTHHVGQLIVEKYNNLLDGVRFQLLWLVREMVRNMVPNMDSVCWNLMRNAASGDISSKNLQLIDMLLDIFQENRKWLEKFPWLVASVVYSYLRFIEDHSSLSLVKLKQKEVGFVISLLRDRFIDCLIIGRDLVRLLQNVSRIPEIESLWRDMLYNPTTLAPNFTGILQLLQTRTSRRFLQSRLTPDMERKLVFFTSNVRFGNHKRYQDWFQKQYLATPESQTLRSDLIRFIVGVIHPTNELLSSDIIPRWAVIGWLITTCTSSVALANAKLALFYDWLFYEKEKDNIMNIEPAILVMTNSLKTHASVTAGLLDFLCRIIPNFYPPLTERVRNGVYTSLYQILEKRVLSSLLPLFETPRLDRELRTMIRENFAEFCEPVPLENVALGNKVDEPVIKGEYSKSEKSAAILNSYLYNQSVVTKDPSFSDEETESSNANDNTNKSGKVENPVEYPPAAKVKLKPKLPHDIPLEAFRSLRKDMKFAIQKLYSEINNGKSCDAMDNVIKLISDSDNLEMGNLTNLALTLSSILRVCFEDKVFPGVLTEQSLQGSLNKPYFSLFKNVLKLSENVSRKNLFLTILSELRVYQPKVGYLFLYYLQATGPCPLADNNIKANSKMTVYKEFCHAREKKFEDCFLSDLQICQEEEVNMFMWMIPTIYHSFSRFALNNNQLMRLVVSATDAKQLQSLICLILQGQLTMVNSDMFVSLVTSSLNWETFEQYCLWQLATAHDIALDCILSCLPKLDFTTHNEAITCILLLLRRERPSSELIKPVFCRELKPLTDTFVSTVLHCWHNHHTEILAEVIAALLTSRCPAASPTKRKRGQGQGLGSRSGVSPPSAERILGHLDRVRNTCQQLFKEDCMQKALRVAHAACTDTQRGLYSNLFSLLEEEEQSSSGNSKSGVTANNTKSRGRRTTSYNSNVSVSNSYLNKHRSASTRSSLKDLTDSSADNSSEEEEVVIKPRNTKKRKKISNVTSDSD